MFQRMKGDFFIWICLLLLVGLYLCHAKTYLYDPIPPDAELIYLPYAKRLLSEGLPFMATPESIYVSPFSFIWPAMFGGEAMMVKTANMYSGVIMLLLVYCIGKQIYSKYVGLLAALLFATSPFLIRWVPPPLTEAPFFLFTLLWIWATGEVIVGRKWAIPIAAVGLTLSILTRTVWLYPSILLLIIATGLQFMRPVFRPWLRRLVLAIGFGLLIPLAVIARNMLLFELPVIDTGTGGALYYGANIMTNGFEPPLLGMNYEDAGDSRSLLGSQKHAAVAIQFFNERTWGEIVAWYTQKISWVMLFTRLDAPLLASLYRIVELAMVAVCFWWGVRHRRVMILLLVAGVAIQILQTGFALYNIRYSIGNVELLLPPLVAVGFVVLSHNLMLVLKICLVSVSSKCINRNDARLLSDGSQFWIVAAAALITLLGTAWFSGKPIIHLPSQIPYLTLFYYKPESALKGSGSIVSTFDANVIEVPVPAQIIPYGYVNAIWRFDLTVKPGSGQGCTHAAIQLSGISTNKVGSGEMATFDVIADGQPHSYLIGTAMANANLFPDTSGQLKLTFNCSIAESVEFHQVALIVPQIIKKYFGSSGGADVD